MTHEIRALLLFRFAVLPYSVKNYGLGALPSVRLQAFSLTALVGDFPFTVAFAYAGHSVQSLLEVAEGRESAMGGSGNRHGSLMIMALSLFGTFGMLILIARQARAKIEVATSPRGSSGAGAGGFGLDLEGLPGPLDGGGHSYDEGLGGGGSGGSGARSVTPRATPGYL